MRLQSGSQIRDLRDCLIRGVWECNSFHQLGLTHFQLSYLCNVFQMAEIYTPKASIFYLESYLKPSETMKAFKQNKSYSLSFFNTESRWNMAYHSHKKSVSISIHQNRNWTVIWVNHGSQPQISVVFVLVRDFKIEPRVNDETKL